MFEGENIHKFHRFRATRESFLREMWGVPYTPMIGFKIPRKFSLRNGHFLLIRENFLP